MSRTDKDRSSASMKRETGVSWWNSPDYGSWIWKPPTNRKTSRLKASYTRRYWNSERFRVRQAIRNGHDPEPSRPRGQVEWDIS